MKIDWDKDKQILTVGKAEFNCYKSYSNPIAWVADVCKANGVTMPDAGDFKTEPTRSGKHKRVYDKPFKQYRKELSDILQCDYMKLYKYFDGLQKKMFVVPIFDMYKKVRPFEMRVKGLNARYLQEVWQNKDILQPVYDDGLYNILPIVNVTKKSPKELSKLYGNAWKEVAKNSNTKNKHLVKLLKTHSEEYRTAAIQANLPSSLLKSGYCYRIEEMLWIKTYLKGSWNKPEKVSQAQILYNDTKHMAASLNLKFNPKWTPRRMREEHDKMAKEISARKFPKNVYDWVVDFPVKSLEHEGYIAALLDNSFAIAEEGTAMNHCVASYADYSKKGDYLVYSITKNGERSSTLGISVEKEREYQKITISGLEEKYPVYKVPAGYKFNQHYARFDQPVEDENEKALGKLVVEALNKQTVALKEA